MRKLVLVIMLVPTLASADQIIFDQYGGGAKIYGDEGQVTQVIPQASGGYNIYQPDGQVDQAVPTTSGYNYYEGSTFDQPTYEAPSYGYQGNSGDDDQ